MCPKKRHNSGEAGAGDTLLHAWGILMGKLKQTRKGKKVDERKFEHKNRFQPEKTNTTKLRIDLSEIKPMVRCRVVG